VAFVALNDVWAMLNACAPGFTATETTHHYCIRYKERTYPTLPLGEHGSRRNPEIKIGHVRHRPGSFSSLRAASISSLQDC
jgi:hypothetical protein